MGTTLRPAARNRAMAARLDAMAQDGKERFVVVGLLHLVGDRGIKVIAATKTDRVHGEPIEDFVSALARTDDGIVVTLATGYTFSPPKPRSSP